MTSAVQSGDLPARAREHQVLHEPLGSDLNRLAAPFAGVCERHRWHRDYRRYEVHAVLRKVITCFPAHRTRVRASG